MSALEELDRYIQQHEVTLQSISKQKLTRKPSERSLISVSNASQFDISMGFQSHQPSIDSALQGLIMRLKQMQQSRLSQLQQANALFLHEMNIEDQFNMQIRTEDEHNKALAEEEFEAFLLGESNPAKPTSPIEHENLTVMQPAPSQQTLFTKRSLTSMQTGSQSTQASQMTGTENAQSSEESKTDSDDLSMSFTDDVMLNLQRNRLDRTQRLRNIATSIQCMSAQSSKYPVSTFRSDALDLSTLPPPPPPPPRSELPLSQPYAPHVLDVPNHTHHAPQAARNQNKIHVYEAAQEQPITLQSILEDEQFDVGTPENNINNNTNDKPDFDTTYSIYTNTPAMSTTNAHYTQFTVDVATSNTTARGATASSYLTRNRSKKVIEQELVENARHNLDISAIRSHVRPTGNTTNTSNTNSTNTITYLADTTTTKHAQKPVPRSPTARAIHFNTSNESIHGIGYGSRYGTSSNSITDNNGSIELDWDESSVGSGESNTERNHHRTRSVRTKDTNSNHNAHSNSGIFEYADALESPGIKSGAHKYTNNTHTDSNSRHVVFAELADAPRLQKAASVESKVSDYYQRRMHQLEHGADPFTTSANSTSNTTANPTPLSASDYSGVSGVHIARTNHNSSSVSEYEAYSPERQRVNHGVYSYDSPQPKTPTFPPIFS